MTQSPPPSPSATPPASLPLVLPVAPVTLWTTLAPNAQQQLAQCLSALIRQLRLAQSRRGEEHSDDPD